MQKNMITFRFLSEPGDVNFGGKVHGGAVMKWIDQTAYTCAVKYSSQYCVTVYVGGIRFVNPIHIGDIVEVQARIIYTGRTSMHIGVDIMTINPKTKAEVKATHCVIVFAAVDDAGKTVPVPEWVPETEEEKALQKYAIRLADMRKEINQEMQYYFNE
ncbi:Acyl-CoA hydrolase [Pedobacter steynii]|uniref:Acyl-CoA hydrolase n=1 Tax=Pedobacter steynii TaxID=430522 RepID=A0A1H0M3N3_9SPHI|nr:acyl-CoA thioesterase [Pedobacter steynii]NQX40091.1 acyl-CoA thioesterase [Pedobacter steynii]SDO75068.1 Acyl-CoA hydrolase [Pedobacter steynii]